MNINQRVKEVRNYYGLTLESFGEKLGVGRSAISNIEKGERNLTNQMKKSICREYCINEHWLETGEGEMKSTKENNIGSAINNLISKDTPFYEIIEGILISYEELEPSDQEAVTKYCEKIIENISKNNEAK